MTALAAGAPAPLFTLSCDDGASFDLFSERGRFVVLFFYPEDDTEGCTIENREFSDLAPDFAELGATLVGISPNAIEQHARFRRKYGLEMRLAADPDRIAIEAYGIWGEKTTFGHAYVGLIRTTFIIAPDGTIAEIIPVPRIRGHAARILERIRHLRAKN
ncbi:MAG: peroxiredoxin [Alphaproteobacteria bacterium]|nr:peroxiredoxin [Alphaproteobacteria bacterium]